MDGPGELIQNYFQIKVTSIFFFAILVDAFVLKLTLFLIKVIRDPAGMDLGKFHFSAMKWSHQCFCVFERLDLSGHRDSKIRNISMELCIKSWRVMNYETSAEMTGSTQGIQFGHILKRAIKLLAIFLKEKMKR